ncbi:hypothetical protein BJF88_05445 [Cellulosimicrobium sp. CUA-896]|nr:hypothetical protein BJF88_05445 [Cellulosimicrobium sp. CUA-896]
MSSDPPAPSRRSARPSRPEPGAARVPGGTPSLTTSRTLSRPSCWSVMVHDDAVECRTTFVTPSRTTQASASCAAGPTGVSSPWTTVSTPAERSTERAPASSAARSAER